MRTMVPVGADQLWAEDSEADGPPLVLLHPGIGDLRVWDPIWADLTETFRVIRYDFRGYGGSPAPTEPYSWLDDLLAVLAHFGLDSAHLVGNSNGGATALALAVQEPDAVRSLVLLAPGVSGYDWPDEPELEATWRALAAAGDTEGIVDLYLDAWAAAGHEPFVRDLARSGIAAEAGEGKFLRELPPVYDRLGEIAVPSVLLLGDRDKPELIAADKQIVARIPGCRLVWMAGVDHLPSIRQPDLVVQAIRELCG
jgi:3-oxoadipate enol-lactonase